MTPRQPLGLQPHPAREQRPPKRLFPPFKKSHKKRNGKRFQKVPVVLAVPAVTLRGTDHSHDTFPCPSRRDLSFKTLRTPAGSTRLENRPTKPGHLGQGALIRSPPILDQAPTSWPLSHGPQPPITPLQSLGLQPHPARERLRRKRLFPPLKNSQENKGEKQG